MVDTGERASFISNETVFHLLSCYLQNTSPGVASWKTTFVVDLGEAIGIVLTFLKPAHDQSSSVTFHLLS